MQEQEHALSLQVAWSLDNATHATAALVGLLKPGASAAQQNHGLFPLRVCDVVAAMWYGRQPSFARSVGPEWG